ncbi:MAG: tetratricopeptide repeat protein [Nitrospiria bacterium]
MNLFELTFKEASNAFDDGQLGKAEHLYLRLLENRPEGYADILNKLGVISYRNNKIEKSIAYYKKALKINPRYMEASINLTLAYNDLGAYGKAGDTFTDAAESVRTGPPKPDPFVLGKLANEHAKLGNTYFDLGLKDEALEEYRRALSMCPQFVDVLTKMGVVLREKNRLDDAIRCFTKAKEVNPKYTAAMVHLGVTYYLRGFFDLALEEWEQAKKINAEEEGLKTCLALFNKKIVEPEYPVNGTQRSSKNSNAASNVNSSARKKKPLVW